MEDLHQKSMRITVHELTSAYFEYVYLFCGPMRVLDGTQNLLLNNHYF